MSECPLPNYGDYVVVQRQSFMKLHKLAPSGSVKLGKSLLVTDNIVGKPYWTTYRMEPKKEKKGVFNLVECSRDEAQSQDLMPSVSSGSDNRNIVDDGSSQKLSSDEIVGMREEGLSSKEIVGTLIENSSTFQEKTEYSQEKYLKKKEKKYFEYVIIRKPTVRLISDIMYKQDPNKVMGLRLDTLSQLSTAVNLHPHGKYIMYESGCKSLASAAILNCLSPEGRLILVHPGSNPQQQAIQGLNFSKEENKRLIYVNIYTLLRRLTNDKINFTGNDSQILTVKEVNDDLNTSITTEDTTNGFAATKPEAASTDQSNEPLNIAQNVTGTKRKRPEEEEYGENKKPRHEVEADIAVTMLKEKKADGLIIVCKEHPANIVKTFLPFVGPSRNFVVFGAMREALQELSIEMKKRPDVIHVQLSEMWLRNYQVMENRTHPFVSMSGGGGYLLTGVVVD